MKFLKHPPFNISNKWNLSLPQIYSECKLSFVTINRNLIQENVFLKFKFNKILSKAYIFLSFLSIKNKKTEKKFLKDELNSFRFKLQPCISFLIEHLIYFCIFCYIKPFNANGKLISFLIMENMKRIS